MGILRTLGRVFAGFALACLTAGLVQVMFVQTPAELANVPASSFPKEATSVLEQVLFAATQFAIFSAAFAFIAAGIAEWLGLRNVGYWLAAGVGIAVLGFIAQYASEVSGQPSILNNYALQSYLTAGFFGGLVYWLVAGVRSGARHEQLTQGDGAWQRPRIIIEKAPRAVKMGSLAERLALKRASKDAAAADPAPDPSPAQASPATPQANAAKPPQQAPQPAQQSAAPAAPATAVPVTRPEGAGKQQTPSPSPKPAAPVPTSDGKPRNADDPAPGGAPSASPQKKA